MFEEIRKEFPILKNTLFEKKFVYLDSAASTQKPQVVIDRLNYYYKKENANIHRGPYDLSIKATQQWQWAHEKIASFINANSYKEIVFVRNTTEGLNFLVQTFGRKLLKEEDIVVVSEMEHHSNIVPWMLLQKEIPFKIEYIPIKENFILDIEWLKNFIKKEGKRVKIVSVVHVSNVLGIKNDVEEIFKIAKENGSFTILDAAQSIVHIPIDVSKIGCDALCFSGHKAYAPTGTGAVYIKEKYLKELTPWMGGGEMVSYVSFKDFGYNELPWKFEAGTPDIGGGIVLGYAIEWFEKKIEEIGGWENLIKHEQELVEFFFKQFDSLEWFKSFGPRDSSKKYGAITFHIDGFIFRGCKDIHKKESNKDGKGISKHLNKRGVAFREGYHCAEPLHDKFNVGPSLRFSLGIYTNKDDLKYAANTLKEAVLSGQ